MIQLTVRSVKRIGIGVIGFTILILGIVMIVLPGPAFIVIPLGIAVLATEFAWARWAFVKAKFKLIKMGVKPVNVKPGWLKRWMRRLGFREFILSRSWRKRCRVREIRKTQPRP